MNGHQEKRQKDIEVNMIHNQKMQNIQKNVKKWQTMISNDSKMTNNANRNERKWQTNAKTYENISENDMLQAIISFPKRN